MTDLATNPIRRRGRRATVGGSLAIGAAAALVTFLALPVVVLLAWAGSSIGSAFTHARILDALALSAVTTGVSLAITIALGTPLAWLLARRSVPGRTLVEGIVDLPLVLPPAVAGLALLLVLGRRGVLGSGLEALGIEIPFTTAAVVLAQVFVSAPYYVRSARAGLQAIPRDLEDAARVDGAGEGATFRFVSLPMAAPALAAGAVLAWARSLGEFGATILFAGNVVGRTQTLPLVVYSEFGAGDLDAAIAAAAVLVVAALAVLLVARTQRPWGDAAGAAG